MTWIKRSRSAITLGTPPSRAISRPIRLSVNSEDRGDGFLDDLVQVDLGGMPFGVARLDLGHVQHLVDQPRQALGFLDDDGEEFSAVR
jgi:hypothetical protein